MGKLHELLASEETVVSAAEKLVSETAEKFNKHTEFFTGHVRTLTRVQDTVADKAIEQAGRKVKELPSNVPETIAYILPYMAKALNLKASKHLTNQKAVGDIILRGQTTVATGVPVDFLLDLEKAVPRWRKLFEAMPTLDPSRIWEKEAKGVWKSTAPATVQTERVVVPVVLSEATDKFPAQVKESTKDIIVGTFNQTDLSGAATTDQKADVLALLDDLFIAVREARMRANTAEQVKSTAGQSVLALIAEVFK